MLATSSILTSDSIDRTACNVERSHISAGERKANLGAYKYGDPLIN